MSDHYSFEMVSLGKALTLVRGARQLSALAPRLAPLLFSGLNSKNETALPEIQTDLPEIKTDHPEIEVAQSVINRPA